MELLWRFSHDSLIFTYSFFLGAVAINFFLSFHYSIKSLEDRLSALENTLDRVSNFRGTLNGLLEQLKGMRAKLNSHEPPHVTPPAVEDQAKDLMVSGMYVWWGVGEGEKERSVLNDERKKMDFFC